MLDLIPVKRHPFLPQWLILGCALLVLGGFIIQNIYSEHLRVDLAEREQLVAQAKVIDQNIANQLDSIGRTLASIRNDKFKGGMEYAVPHLKVLVDAMRGVRTILITDAHGTVTDSNREQLIGQNFKSREYFQAPLLAPSSETLYISPPFTTSLNVFSMSVSRAIMDADGHFAGVITATLEPVEFDVLMNSVRYTPDMWTSLTHGTGVIFMMTPHRQDVVGKNLAQPGTFFIRHLVSKQDTSVFSGTVYATGENRMIALRTIQPEKLKMDHPLVVAVARDLPTIFANWRLHAYIQVGLFGVLSLTSIFWLLFYQLRQRAYLIERERAERKIRETSEELDRFFTLSLDLLCIADIKGHFLRLNRAWETTLGYPLSELEGAAFFDYVHPDDIDATQAAMSQLSADKEVLNFVNRYRCKDGSYRWIEWYSKPYQDTLIYAVARDVTAKKQAEEEKAMQTRNQRALLNAIQESTFLMERDGTMLLINDVGAQRLNVKPEELIGKNVYEILPPKVAQSRREQFERIAKNGKAEAMEDERAGQRFLSSIYPVFDAEGVVVRFAVYAADVTQQHRQQAIDEMLSAINQEILQGASLHEVLTAICHKVSVLFRLDVVWLGRKEPGGAISVLGEAGLASNYIACLQACGVRWDDTPQGRGPAGSAIRFGHPQKFSVSEQNFQVWATIARENNLQSILAIPLVIRGEIYGVFTLYSSNPILFDEPKLTEQLNSISKRICIALEAAMDQEQVRLLSSALEAAGNGVLITDQRGRIEWTNPAFSKLCGYSRQELLGQTPRILKSGKQSPEYYQTLWATISKGENWSSEAVERAKDGNLYTVSQTITPIISDGELTHFIAIHEDITAQKLTQGRIEHMAHYDALTGLPNRALFYDRLKQALLLAKRSQEGLGLLYMDLDGFKKINDTLGHHAGDLLLKKVADRLSGCVRESDTVARLGGDEFTIILNETHKHEDVSVIATKIIEAIAVPYDLDGQPAKIGISIGIARYAADADTADELMMRADEAMYQAKSVGKNTYRISSSEAN
ncbi:MAG: diguanylate cyclase [Gallionella sp.]|nr:diguanylate cyclase [Gallionella sp.]